MKNKHRIILALMASLGLMTFGAKNTNAKNNVPNSTNSQVKSAKVLNSTHNNLNHVPKNTNSVSIMQKLSTSNPKIQKINQSNNKSVKSILIKNTSMKKDTNHGLIKEIKPSLHKSNSSHFKDDLQELNKINHLNHRKNHVVNANPFRHHMNSKRYNMIKHKIMKHHHNLVHIDNNPQNIDGMNQFTDSRYHYLYDKVGGNTRDLGGYSADHGKYQIAPDRIIRSADLDGLSRSGAKTLKHLHVNKVIDLRFYTGKEGIQGHPDPSELHSRTLKGTGIDYQLDPVYTHTEASHLSKYMKTHDEHGEYYYYGDLSVSKPQAIKTYRRIFRDLLNNHHGAILFHCNLGRDRTGVTSALILSALGVNRNTIYHDYLLTYRYHYHFLVNDPAYAKHAAELQYFFKTIDKKYGSVQAYLSNEIGLTHANLMKLRKMYLISNRG